MWFTQAEFEKHIQTDTIRRLDFSDDGPSVAVWQEDGTYTSIFLATPAETFTCSEPTFQAAVIYNIHPDDTEDWQIATFEAPHPGSFETTEEQHEGFWNPLFAAAESIESNIIDRTLNLRYFAWKDADGSY